MICILGGLLHSMYVLNLVHKRRSWQSWARYPMDKRLLKAAREGDEEALGRLVGGQEQAAGTTSSHDDVTAAEQVDEVDGQGGPAMDKRLLKAAREGDAVSFRRLVAPNEREIAISIPPEPEANEMPASAISAPGMNRTAEINSILQGASSDGDGVLHIAARHGHVELTRAVFDALGIKLPDPNVGAAAEPEKKKEATSCALWGLSCQRSRANKKEGATTVTSHPMPSSADDATNGEAGQTTRTVRVSEFLRARNHKGETCLHEAVRCGHTELVALLVSADAILDDDKSSPALVPDPNVGAATESSNKKEGGTPVSGAASTVASLPMPSSADDAVRFSELLRARNHKGETCLHEAVRCGHTELVELLVKEDARLDDDKTSPALVKIADDEGVSPLYLASTLRKADIVGVLTDKQRCRYSPSYSGPGRKTALHAAVLLNKELTEQLLDWNKDLINTADESGSTPLHFLASAGHEIIAKLLLEKDSDSAYCPDAKGSLPIHVAGAEGRLDMIKQLLQACPDCIWSLDSSGRSFLHAAVEKRQAKVVAYVCKKKWPARFFNIRDKEGDTALHLAVRNGNQWVFCSLIRNNEVHLSLTNKEGHTPLDLAELSIPSGLRYLQASREWILYDLLLAGADFGICRWDHFTSKITEPGKEKVSKEISKSAGLGAVCAVLILTVAFAAPFNVAKFYLDSSGGARSKKSWASQQVFGAFIIFDAMTFVHSALATCCCTFAGFPIVDYSRARFFFLREAWRCLRYAALSVVVVFVLGVYLVVAPVDVKVAIFACVLALPVIILHGVAVPMMLTHAVALCRRLGFLRWLRSVFQSNTVRLRNRRPPYYRYPPLHPGSWLVVIGYLVSCGLLVVDSAIFKTK